MISERLDMAVWVLLGAICLTGCGNYSNEDLDFQLALPEQSDIAVKMQLSVTRYNSAEYYLATRSAITTFNNMVVDLTGLIEVVRGYTPTSRNGNERIWGPFPSDKYPNWEIRVRMQRSTVSSTLLHMEYQVEVRMVGQDGAWVPFLTGSYTSQGSARTGTGEIHLLASDARNALYPVNDDPGLVNLDHLDVTYDNSGFPITVEMKIVNLPSSPTQSGAYTYAQNEDGSGRMTFDWQGVTDTGVPITANMTSQWLGSGAGRADLTANLTPNLPTPPILLLGTDCWGLDTVASYSYRLRDSVTNLPSTTGSIDTCLF
jgi:hypothetical protein